MNKFPCMKDIIRHYRQTVRDRFQVGALKKIPFGNPGIASDGKAKNPERKKTLLSKRL